MRTAEQARGQLHALFVLACEPKSWAPLTIAGVLWRAASNPLAHRNVCSLGKNPIYAQHIQKNPRFLFKFLTHDYLARNLSVPHRALCFAHHYRRLHALLSDGILRRILANEEELFSLEQNGHRFSIAFGYSHPWNDKGEDKEGELSLQLRVDQTFAYILSFSIVPGKVVGCPDPDALLISRLQGGRGKSDTVALVHRSLHYIKPEAMLVAALDGIADALDIRQIACVCGVHQTAYRREFGADFITAYDDFFSEHGVQRSPAGFYLYTIPFPDKPLEQIRSGKRQRSRARRALKQQITEQVYRLLGSWRRGQETALAKLRFPTEQPANHVYGN